MKNIIFITGVGDLDTDVSLAGYARRYAKALDKNDDEKKYTYSVELSKQKLTEEDAKDCEIAIIKRTLPGAKDDSEILYKLFEYSYQEEFLKSFNENNIFIKSLKLSWGVFKMLPVFFRALFNGKGLAGKQKRQSLYFFFILILLSTFVFLLMPSLLAIVLDNSSEIKHSIGKLLDIEGSKTAVWCAAKLKSLLIYFDHFSHFSVAFASAVAILFPMFQQRLSITAARFLCVHYYLKYGENKARVTGELANLIEKISETENSYDGFEIHAYSFGSIIAIDTLFPKSPNQVDKRVSNEISDLLTIGCGFDFIRVYYPYYFASRPRGAMAIKSWYNVNTQLDILSSNFRNDSENLDGDESLSPGALKPINIPYEINDPNSAGFIDNLLLYNFKTHSMYWDNDVNGLSFFTNYINKKNNPKNGSI